MRRALAIILLTHIAVTLYRTVVPLWGAYTAPYFTDNAYEAYERAFWGSQYRQKENPGIIPDETVFSYAAGAYVRGIDPILINAEHTPLGKYIIGMFILLMKNDKFTVIPFAFLTVFALWVLGRVTLRDGTLALIPVTLFVTEPLFLNQIRTAPLLDILQLPWILGSFVAFLTDRKRNRFLLTAMMLGVVAATKTVVPAMLLFITFTLSLCAVGCWKSTVRLAAWSLLSCLIFTASYARTFMSGYTLFDFIGFQKWIFLYQRSKLIFPLSSWRLLLLNQWQTWWGDNSILQAQDWRWTWPVSTVLGLIAIWLVARRKISRKEPIVLLILWVGVYSAFLSLGTTSSRFFLPLFPISFLVATWMVRYAYERFLRRYH